MVRYGAAVGLSDEQKAITLGSVPLFSGISAESMSRLVAVTGEQEFAEGQFIVRQGQVGTGLYAIVDGIGELSVIDQQPRNASVQAAEPTTVLAVASWDLLALLENDPALALNLIKGLVARVRATGDQHRH